MPRGGGAIVAQSKTTAVITPRGPGKRFGNVKARRGIDLVIMRRKFAVLAGCSGRATSTLHWPITDLGAAAVASIAAGDRARGLLFYPKRSCVSDHAIKL
jgi:ABC-type branched-subunit amino acid transport system ATPase component